MSEQIHIDGIEVSVRRNARARRMTLRVPRAGGSVVLTLPMRASLSSGREFVQSKADWLRRTVAAMPGPQLVVDGLNFANGFYLDETNGKFYLSETMANRVLVFTLDVAAGTLSDRKVLAEVPSPDNMRLAPDGSLWVASPASNQVIAIDSDTGTTRVVFDAQTEAGAKSVQEWLRRSAAGESAADLLNPEVQGDMPGVLTGIIIGREDQPFYVSNLGNALVKVER